MNTDMLFDSINKSFLKSWVFFSKGTWFSLTVFEMHEEKLHLLMEQMEGDTLANIILHIEKQYGKNYALSIVLNKHEKGKQ